MWHGSAVGRAKPQFWGAGWLGAEWRQEPNLERSHKRSSPTSTLLRWQFPCHIHRAHFPPCIPFFKGCFYAFIYLFTMCVYVCICCTHATILQILWRTALWRESVLTYHYRVLETELSDQAWWRVSAHWATLPALSLGLFMGAQHVTRCSMCPPSLQSEAQASFLHI